MGQIRSSTVGEEVAVQLWGELEVQLWGGIRSPTMGGIRSWTNATIVDNTAGNWCMGVHGLRKLTQIHCQ